MKKKITVKQYLDNFYDILMIPSMRVLPGSLAFFTVMSIVPMITLVALLCSKFSLNAGEVTTFLGNILPNDVENLLLNIFEGVDSNMSLWAVFLGLILASNGPHSIILASNTLYDIPNKPYLGRRIKALFLTLIMMLLFLITLVVLAFGNIILKFILSIEFFSLIASEVYSVFLILKWPIAIIIIFILIKVLYTIAPDSKIPSKYTNRGALFSTFGLVISSSVFSYYANNIADYSYVYGNLANIIALMMLLYFISLVLVMGIAINANNYNLNKEKNDNN